MNKLDLVADAMSDALRECQIEQARIALDHATSPESRAALWAQLRSLILARSPAQIERMEKRLGLR
ncbi:hypothetical protein [Burkholderia gladioli]|uniref:hypothetical protein n=1 Tax=Burkholderia gladioli TaxID=28095 RepID=UPI001640DE1C|nr:hypothetical protein [Burkholderia gladioli]